jgi:RimJ/RimL family protein N-acetyltransferase
MVAFESGFIALIMGYNPNGTMQISFPLIETARLKLRPPSSDDVSTIHSLWSDPEVTRFIPIIMFRTPDEIVEFVRLSRERWKERGFGIFVVVDKESDKMIGYCGLQYLDSTTEIEIYYGFFKENWNKGVATEAAKAVLRFGFEELKAPNIAAITLPENRASQTVLQKLGLQKTGENRFFRETECLYYVVGRDQYSSNGDCYKLTYP